MQFTALPLGSPVDVDSRETSAFGYRTDPFNRKTAFHEGAECSSVLWRADDCDGAWDGDVRWGKGRLSPGGRS